MPRRQKYRFLPLSIKIRQVTKSMSVLKNGDLILDDNDAIAIHVLRYYSSLYASSNDCIPNDLISSVVPSLVSSDDNNMLSKLPTHEEIKDAVFSLNGDGAPGPDGFGGCFYQAFWDIGGLMSADLCPNFSLKVGCFQILTLILLF